MDLGNLPLFSAFLEKRDEDHFHFSSPSTVSDCRSSHLGQDEPLGHVVAIEQSLREGEHHGSAVPHHGQQGLQPGAFLQKCHVRRYPDKHLRRNHRSTGFKSCFLSVL